MRELVDFLVGNIIDKETYDIIVMNEDDQEVEIKVLVDKDVVGKLIGKGGRIAKAIRTIVRASSSGSNQKYDVFIRERVDDKEISGW